LDDSQFLQLLNRFELSWEGYRKVRKGVKKRIRRHMQRLGCDTVSAYLAKLDFDNESRVECERLMSVSISRFFRDRGFWESLEQKILPDLLETCDKSLDVWSAGCACGEEVYSFQIVWDHLKKIRGILPELRITATDLNPFYIDKAKAGVYHFSSLKEVNEEVRFRCFDMNGRKTLFSIKPKFKGNINWRQHQFFADPPALNFHIIFLRNNLLTYYQEHLKKAAFKKVLKSLNPGGIVVIGSHEDLPFYTSDLIPVKPFSYVFKKQPQGK
jgi:chemotaxis protein methyltransferase CheR